ncbi:MAG: hypothetical protein OM95_07050 [Bdellovibrio sp. ArHS]|uniref:hypothetical protein n=1 Tax=Bdellovibrio sp. ArHS TaxID=1569284 RepID=UPI0005824E81|nr:hypothetical protein [Bdellovibrio sp. ArHS]KHD88866.1 MAG: hypothetical protein OM95_07050 [Bdellovibrio sp. ArHS]
MKPDLVKALGVEVRRVCVVDNSFPNNTVNYRSVIYLEDLRAALEKLPVMEGKITFVGTPDNPQAYAKFEVVDKPHCTHSARLFAIEEIKREPLKVEYTVAFPEGHRAFDVNGTEFGSQLAGGRFRVRFEEIKEG